MIDAKRAGRRLQQAVAYAMLMLFSLAWFSGQAAAQARTPAASRAETGYRLDVKGVQGQALPKDVEPAQVHKIVDGDTIEIVYPPSDW